MLWVCGSKHHSIILNTPTALRLRVVQGVNTPEKAAGEGRLEKGLKNVGSKFIAVEQLVAQSAATVKERNGILPPDVSKGVSVVALLRGPAA